MPLSGSGTGPWIRPTPTAMQRHRRRLVGFPDQSIAEVGDEKTHALASLMELVGVLLER